MLARILKGLAVLCAAAVVVALSMTWVIVSVVIPEDGLRLWIPAPVALAHAAAVLVDHPALDQTLPIQPEHIRAAAAALRELEEVDDAELVRVESGDQLVVVRKSRDRLVVEVDGGEDRIRVDAPIREIRAFLEDYEDSPLQPKAFFRLARSLPSGPLVEVSEPGTSVSVRVW